jgi:hypothetical protein
MVRTSWRPRSLLGPGADRHRLPGQRVQRGEQVRPVRAVPGTRSGPACLQHRNRRERWGMQAISGDHPPDSAQRTQQRFEVGNSFVFPTSCCASTTASPVTAANRCGAPPSACAGAADHLAVYRQLRVAAGIHRHDHCVDPGPYADASPCLAYGRHEPAACLRRMRPPATDPAPPPNAAGSITVAQAPNVASSGATGRQAGSGRQPPASTYAAGHRRHSRSRRTTACRPTPRPPSALTFPPAGAGDLPTSRIWHPRQEPAETSRSVPPSMTQDKSPGLVNDPVDQRR